MSALPRILTIMGSGETTPTMARAHRAVLDRLGERPVSAVLLDTPYGFQENADDISERALAYFRDTVGNPFTVASFRSADADTLARETALVRIREARLAFTGPGSPSYALRQWAGTDGRSPRQPAGSRCAPKPPADGECIRPASLGLWCC